MRPRSLSSQLVIILQLGCLRQPSFGAGHKRRRLNSGRDISSLDHGINKLRNDGAMLDAPFWLLLKAQALHMAGRTLEALETLYTPKHWPKYEANAICSPNSTGFAVHSCGHWCWRGYRTEASFSQAMSESQKEQQKVDFTGETRGSNLRRIPAPKSDLVRRKPAPPTSLLM